MEHLIAFFNDILPLPDKIIDLMGDLFVFEELKKGDYFVKEGETATGIAFLESGIVRAFYINSEGKEYNKSFFSAPSKIGCSVGNCDCSSL